MKKAVITKMIIGDKKKNFNIFGLCLILFSILMLNVSYFEHLTPFPEVNEVKNNFILKTEITEIFEPESSYILKSKESLQPIGNITILSIEDMGCGNFTVEGEYGMEYPNSISYEYLTDFPSAFLGVQHAANLSVWDSGSITGDITIRINESVRFDYLYNDSKTITNFKSILSDSDRSTLHKLTVNGTEIDLDNESLFLIDNGYYVFNYSSVRRHDIQYPNGTIILGYEIDYDLKIRGWQMTQIGAYQEGTRPVYLNNDSTTFNAYYNYTFSPGKLDNTLDLTAKYLINIPDSDFLSISSVATYAGNIVTGNVTLLNLGEHYILKEDNSVELTVDLKNGETPLQYSINSETNFTVEFINRYCSSWTKDYLYSGRDSRVRQYEISCVAGPPNLFVSHFSINETTIPFNDKISITSELIEHGAQRRVIATSNMTALCGTIGTTIFSYEESILGIYPLFVGETDTITIRYSSWRTLNLTVVDNINQPLQNVEVRLYYENVTYGTLMFDGNYYPITPKITDLYGQVSFPDVPYGNYKVEIFYGGVFIQNSTISTIIPINIISTSIPHFPMWILIFSSISFILALVGFIIYRRFQK
ncbi:MAG: hypothetical protein ACTSWY_01465 [Promethearchaeota archaeon]